MYPIDYSSLELRALAQLGITMKPGFDPHQALAVKLGVSRQKAKSFNFSLMYGGFPFDWPVTPDVGNRRTGLRTREWFRWLSGWTRGRTHGHQWDCCFDGAICSRCGFYLPTPSRGKSLRTLPQKPERRRRERPSMSCDHNPQKLRRTTLDFLDSLGPCDQLIVRRVMDS